MDLKHFQGPHFGFTKPYQSTSYRCELINKDGQYAVYCTEYGGSDLFKVLTSHGDEELGATVGNT